MSNLHTVHLFDNLAEKRVHFALLLPMSSGLWDWGLRIAGAAALAVEKVNTNRALLPGHVLEYSWANSGCSAQQGLAAMGELLQGERRIDAVIGPGCNSACEVTSALSGGKTVSQISYRKYFSLHALDTCFDMS